MSMERGEPLERLRTESMRDPGNAFSQELSNEEVEMGWSVTKGLSVSGSFPASSSVLSGVLGIQ